MKFITSLFIPLAISIGAFVNLIGYYYQVSNAYIEVLDVGQGDSIVVKTTSNNFGLIDAGKNANILKAFDSLSHRPKNFEFIILTHPDADHIEGVIEVVKYFEVKKLFINKTLKTNDLLLKIEETIEEKNLEIFELTSLNDFNFAGFEFNVLWPPDSYITNQLDLDDNDLSISLEISYGNFTFITMGDLSSNFEDLLFKDKDFSNIDVLKLSHHGSKTSTSMWLLEKLRPKIAVISAGKDNSYGHPHKEVLNNLNALKIKSVSTIDIGNIKFEIFEDKFLIKGEKFENSYYSS